MEDKKLNVGILIFNEVEVLDFAGPFEVFSIAENLQTKEKLFNVFTLAEEDDAVGARNDLQILPHYTIETAPKIDILIVPGGRGADEIEIHNTFLLNWLKEKQNELDTLASICTGAFLLAKAGILNNLEVTTHWMDIEKLQEEYPKLNVVKDRKFVDQGQVMTAAGISAGIELSLYIVAKYSDKETALFTAKRMEYDLHQSTIDQF